MTFPLGSLRSESDAPLSPYVQGHPVTYQRDGNAAAAAIPHPPAGWRAQLMLLITGVLWLLALLALTTHNGGDAAFSTSGASAVTLNKAGVAGAWFSDLAYFVFGYSVWWAVVGGVRAWLGTLASLLRSDQPVVAAPAHSPAPPWQFWVGLALLLVASASLEWSRLYQWEARVAGGHAGGALGYTVGSASMKLLGFAGSGVLWIATLVVGVSMTFRFSWLRLAEGIGAWVESLRERRVERIERAEDARVGEQALRERELVVEFEHQRHEDHLPIVIEAPVIDVPRSARVAKERASPIVSDEDDTVVAPLPWLSSTPTSSPTPTPTSTSTPTPTPSPSPSPSPSLRAVGIDDESPGPSRLPQVELLDEAPVHTVSVAPETLEMTSRLIEKKLKDFGVEVRVVSASPGPVITRYEIEPATGVKGSQIVGLAKDLARSLSLISIRVVETIPGRTTMALELPNSKRQTIRLSEILGSQIYADAASPLTMGLGKDIVGNPMVADLGKMPHCLVAGTTGSGKSVGINAMILSLLYKAEARDVRLILIDPKMLEMSVYEGIPHLLCPVVTDMKQAANALNWGVGEMERRYKLMSKMGVRNLASYNKKIDEATERGDLLPNPFSLTPDEPEPLDRLPFIVIVIDELADLMMVVGKKIEELIARLAQKARACGIHLILATQRPSVDVITGLIKANIPTRLSFQVSSKIDSRTILDQMGAEALLGMGDMLYMASGSGLPVRVHGAFVSDDEVHRVVNYLKSQGDPNYIEGILEGGTIDGEGGDVLSSEGGVMGSGENDAMYDQAVAVVLQNKRASISLVQRHLRIGYNRAARLLEQMEKSGLVSSMSTNGNRDIIVPARIE